VSCCLRSKKAEDNSDVLVRLGEGVEEGEDIEEEYRLGTHHMSEVLSSKYMMLKEHLNIMHNSLDQIDHVTSFAVSNPKSRIEIEAYKQQERLTLFEGYEFNFEYSARSSDSS
jgi:hypothetical protein